MPAIFQAERSAIYPRNAFIPMQEGSRPILAFHTVRFGLRLYIGFRFRV